MKYFAKFLTEFLPNFPKDFQRTVEDFCKITGVRATPAKTLVHAAPAKTWVRGIPAKTGVRAWCPVPMLDVRILRSSHKHRPMLNAKNLGKHGNHCEMMCDNGKYPQNLLLPYTGTRVEFSGDDFSQRLAGYLSLQEQRYLGVTRRGGAKCYYTRKGSDIAPLKPELPI